jgi:hypothetical protein
MEICFSDHVSGASYCTPIGGGLREPLMHGSSAPWAVNKRLLQGDRVAPTSTHHYIPIPMPCASPSVFRPHPRRVHLHLALALPALTWSTQHEALYLPHETGLLPISVPQSFSETQLLKRLLTSAESTSQPEHPLLITDLRQR